jgi:hypothetical protein
MLAPAPRYPSLGPLFGKAFDQAVRLTLQRWLWLVPLMLVEFAAAFFGSAATIAADNIAAAVWGIVSGAAAVKTVRPDFRMTAARVGQLVTLNITIGFFTGLAALALIIPGIYVAVRWSLANVILLMEDVMPEEARRRSWELAGRHFWKSLLLAVCLVLAQLAAIYLATLAIEEGLMYAVLVRWIGLMPEQVSNLASSLAFPISGYTTMAGWFVYLHWYRSLKEFEAQREQASGAELAAATS